MTRTLASKTVQTGAIAAGFLLFAGGAAQADNPDIVSAGNAGIGNGNQLVAPIQAPIDVCGNAVGALVGVAGAGCQGGSSADLENGPLGDMTSAGNNGILNGNQAQVPIQVPIDVCGNGVAVAGVAGAGCQGGSSASLGENDSHYAPQESVGDMASGVVPGASELPATQAVDQTASDLGVMPPSGKGFTAENEPQPGSGLPGGDVLSGLAGGLPTDGLVGLNNGQDQAPSQTQVPDESDPLGLPGGDAVTGVAGALPTDGVLDVQTQDEAPVDATSAAPQESGKVTENGGDMVSAGNNGILNGTQVQAPIQVPVDVSGNAVGVLGVAGAGSTGGAAASNS